MEKNGNTGSLWDQGDKTEVPSLELSNKEAKEFKEWMIEYQMRDFGFSREEAEQFADIAINAYSEIGQENGESV